MMFVSLALTRGRLVASYPGSASSSSRMGLQKELDELLPCGCSGHPLLQHPNLQIPPLTFALVSFTESVTDLRLLKVLPPAVSTFAPCGNGKRA